MSEHPEAPSVRATTVTFAVYCLHPYPARQEDLRPRRAEISSVLFPAFIGGKTMPCSQQTFN